MVPAIAPLVIIVVGRPASGKSTTARLLVERFGLPLLAKDAFKEILLDRLGSGDRDWSAQLGRAAFDVLDHAIEQQLRARGPFVIDAAFDAQYENGAFQSRQERFGFRAFQIHCVASVDVLVQRFIERAQSGLRHIGHGDDGAIDEYRASLGDGRAETFDLIGEVVELDVAEPTEVQLVLDRVAEALAE